ncbi:hypothetical protein HYG89_06230 [Acinetobacter sp. SwsAc5]|uniref:hypothetical protein n=1 Tax=Acinetobacter sp. SwsAc5 TaxID=2749438 RepID=UPI0015C189C2|nr:hypothetical protein [Acinetobacter sp. SwsAc5]NWK52157.1 hypothetical protein [Acinetobacter sp. SwsAc5]
MYGLKKRSKQDENGLIQGAGTGTSDDIKKNVPAGSYIMPADSTQKIGVNNLKNLGKPSTEVNVSNGEYLLPPEQLQEIGGQFLQRLKQATHTPTEKPQLGFKPGKKTPELFFANGTDENGVPELLKRREQNPMMNQGIGNTLSNGFGKASPPPDSLPNTQAQTAAPPKSNANFGLGEFDLGLEMPKVNLGQMNPANTFRAAFSTANEGKPASLEQPASGFDLLKRREPSQNPMMNNGIKDTLSSGFPSSAAPKSQASLVPSTTNTKPAVTTDAPVATNTESNNQEQPKVDMFDLNQASVNPTQTQENPYAIQQKGNAFSYANPSAAAQARANGVPETLGLGFKVNSAGDPAGVKNLLANTREMGASNEQINRALAQRELNMGMQGYAGIAKQPERPVMSDEEKANRAYLANQIKSAIDPKFGPTAKQAEALLRLSSNDPDAADLYKTDANNAAALQREAMGQTGQNYRAELGEQGENNRFNSNLNFEAQKFNATNNLANRQFSEEQLNNMPARMKQAYELNLLKAYEAAKTPEEKQSIAEKYNFATGRAEQQQKRSLKAVYGGQTLTDQGAIRNPDILIDEGTGQRIDYDSPSQRQQNTPQVGAVVNGYKYKGGDINKPESWEKA